MPPPEIAVDSAGQAYVTGRTRSPDFPAPPRPWLRYDLQRLVYDVFVVKPDSTGVCLALRHLRRRHQVGCKGYGIALDDAGSAYITGHTGSPDFPVTPDVLLDTSYNGAQYFGDEVRGEVGSDGEVC